MLGFPGNEHSSGGEGLGRTASYTALVPGHSSRGRGLHYWLLGSSLVNSPAPGIIVDETRAPRSLSVGDASAEGWRNETEEGEAPGKKAGQSWHREGTRIPERGLAGPIDCTMPLVLRFSAPSLAS